MQNKGLIKFFVVLLALVCVYSLTFTFITNKVENEAKLFAKNKVSETEENYIDKRASVEDRYLDSISNEPVFLGIDYATSKERELNKGLDLKGGINVILQVSVKDILKTLSNNSKHPAFSMALESADSLEVNSSLGYLELFFQEFDKIPDAKYASADIFATRENSGQIDIDMPNEAAKAVIRTKVDDLMTAAFDVIRKRIDKFGVTQPNIQRLGKSGRILVELPGAKDVARVQRLLQSTAKLEFWHVYQSGNIAPFLQQADQYIAELNKSMEEAKEEQDEFSELLDEASDSTEVEDLSKRFPIQSKMLPVQSFGIAKFSVQDTAQIGAYLRMPNVRALLPAEYRFAKFYWGVPEVVPELGREAVDLYAIRANRENKAPIQGDVVVDARQDYNLRAEPIVSMQMNPAGAKVWEEMTAESAAQGTQIAVVLDNTVYSAPVARGAIPGGSTEISGNFSVKEAQDLANVLRAGKLPARADIISSTIVGPSLGQEAIDTGILSFIIALAFVLIWMVFYYGKAGFYADIALALNILFIFGVLASLGAVLTLPGIAGIVLTIGMAVDANVLIFERVREEKLLGKGHAEAVKDGFKYALSSILDANITTFLTAVVLFVFGAGPIQGFATTLMIGIATSLIAALFITRLFIEADAAKGKTLSFSTAITKNWFTNLNIDFLSKRKIAYVISGALILISIVFLTTRGLDEGIDFAGGRTYTVRFDQPVNATQISEELSAVFGSAEAKTSGASNQLKISTKYRVNDKGFEVDEDIYSKLFTALQKYLPAGIDEASFIEGEFNGNDLGVMESMKVGPTIASDLLRGSFYAVLGSLLIVFLYILIRFKRPQYSIGAVAAVFHDVLIVLGAFAAFHTVVPFSLEIDQAFIAAILTVIGYSLNDTVVVFDRIREYFGLHPKWETSRNINSAINTTISRTVNTSLTTLIVLITIFIFGADSIKGFMFALIIGVVVGTYSSVFIATPIMYDTVKKQGLKFKIKEEEPADAEEPAKA